MKPSFEENSRQSLSKQQENVNCTPLRSEDVAWMITSFIRLPSLILKGRIAKRTC
jgi:hypothetical protein